jgi:hypothetical protein
LPELGFLSLSDEMNVHMSHLEIATTHHCCCILAKFASGQGLAFHALFLSKLLFLEALISWNTSTISCTNIFGLKTENIAGAMLTACTFALAGALVLKNRDVPGPLNNNPIALAICIFWNIETLTLKPKT